MQKKEIVKKIKIEIGIIVLFCIILTVILAISFKAWDINWNIPYLSLSADGTIAAASIGNYLNGNSFWDLSNFNSHLVNASMLTDREGIIVKCILFILANLFNSVGLVTNSYAYLTYILVGVLAYCSFRKIVDSKLGAFGGALLYTLLPYHYEKIGYGHLALASYFLVPIICMGVFLLVKENNDINKSDVIFVSIACLLMSGFSLYYACFSLLLLMFAFTFDLFNHRSKLKICILFIFNTILGIAISLWIFTIASNNNVAGSVSSASRDLRHVLGQSLYLFPLAIPIVDHPIAFLREFGWKLRSLCDASLKVMPLGALTILGLIVSFVSIIIQKKEKKEQIEKIQKCGTINIFMIFVSTVGGLSTVIGIVNSSIRNYARLSIFIAYFSILAIICCVDIVSRKLSKRKSIIFNVIITILFLLGIFDITSPSIAKYARYDCNQVNFFKNPYKETEEIYLSYQNFYQEINAKVSEKAVLFPNLQLLNSDKTTNSGEKVDSFHILSAEIYAPDVEWDNGTSLNSDLGKRWKFMQDNLTFEQFLDFAVFLGNKGIVVEKSVVEAYGGMNTSEILDYLYEVSDYSESDSLGDLIYFDLSSYSEQLLNSDKQKERTSRINHVMYDMEIDDFENAVLNEFD